MPVVIFFACLDLEQKSSFMDGHWYMILDAGHRFSPPLVGLRWGFTRDYRVSILQNE